MLRSSCADHTRRTSFEERDTRGIRILATTLGNMRLLLLISILMLGACAGPGVTLPTAWARADGQPTNPELLNIDVLDCKDETQNLDGMVNGKVDKIAVVGDFVSCMREHGYIQIKS